MCFNHTFLKNLLDVEDEDDGTKLSTIRHKIQIVEKMPRVFLLTNGDEADVKSVTNNDDDTLDNDGDVGINADGDDKEFWVYLVPYSMRILFLVIGLANNVCKLDFRFLLTVILFTKIGFTTHMLKKPNIIFGCI